MLFSEVDLLRSHIHLPFFILAQGIELKNLNKILASSLLDVKCVYHFWLVDKQLNTRVEIVKYFINKFLENALLRILQRYFDNIVELIEDNLIDF